MKLRDGQDHCGGWRGWYHSACRRQRHRNKNKNKNKTLQMPNKLYSQRQDNCEIQYFNKKNTYSIRLFFVDNSGICLPPALSPAYHQLSPAPLEAPGQNRPMIVGIQNNIITPKDAACTPIFRIFAFSWRMRERQLGSISLVRTFNLASLHPHIAPVNRYHPNAGLGNRTS